MRYPPEHRREVRQRILDVASRLFRRHGYEAVGINQLMDAAGLTRGGFYGYFESKRDLLAAILHQEPDLAVRLRQEGDATGQAPRAAGERLTAALSVLRDYVHPAHRDAVAGGCSLASAAQDAARQGTHGAFSATLESAAKELDRLLRAECDSPAKGAVEEEGHDPRSLAMLSLCVGTLLISRGVGSGRLADAVSAAGRDGLEALAHDHRGLGAPVDEAVE